MKALKAAAALAGDGAAGDAGPAGEEHEQQEPEKPVLKFRNYVVKDSKHIEHEQVWASRKHTTSTATFCRRMLLP